METDPSAEAYVEKLKTMGVTRAFALYTDPLSGHGKMLVYDDGKFFLHDVDEQMVHFVSINTAYLIIERINDKVYPIRGMGAFKKPLDLDQKEALRYEFHRH
ncbi:MAG TPA: hypothetical protein VFK37_09040 [Bacillales bacterium]|nr:hypothetical protein [Bacillales bacterium]